MLRTLILLLLLAQGILAQTNNKATIEYKPASREVTIKGDSIPGSLLKDTFWKRIYIYPDTLWLLSGLSGKEHIYIALKDQKQFFVDSCSAETITIYPQAPKAINLLYLTNSRFQTIVLSQVEVNYTSLQGSSISGLTLANSFTHMLDVASNDKVPQIQRHRIYSGFNIHPAPDFYLTRRIKLRTNPFTPPDNVDYNQFEISQELFGNPDIGISFFTKALDNERKNGKTRSYENLDVDFHQYKYFHQTSILQKTRGMIDKYWWYYGYRKHYVFWWSLLMIIVFSVINLYLVQSLNAEVYEIDHLTIYMSDSTGSSKLRKTFYISVVYTVLIFFSLNVKIDKLKFHRRPLVCYFFIMYAAGIICLAYLANYFLKI